ncbi:MAG: Ku protein, partial [Mesorhizobium sp.]
PATSASERISFNQLHKKTHNRINMKPVDPELGLVERSDLVKGYEYEDKQYIIIDDTDLDAVRIESNHTMNIEAFVDEGEVDVIYQDAPYYLAPDGAMAEETFAVLREAMRQSGKLAIARLVLSSRERVVTIGARENGMFVCTLRNPNEVRGTAEYFGNIPAGKPDPEMLQLAEALIKQKETTFDPKNYEDRYEIALMAMIVPTFSQRPIVGYSWIVLAAVGTGFLSFGLWVHHMFATGLPQISLAFFSAASEAVAIPTGVQIFVFTATMLAGRVIFSTPMLFGAGGLAIFVIGGLTGVMVALAPFDWQAHDTYFVVAHLHYVLIGGMLFPVVAGLYYYYPLIDAKQLSDRLGRLAFWLMFCGFNIAFFPMHLSGLRGMPRRVFTYPTEIGWDWLNLISTAGAFIFAAGVLVVVLDVLRPKHRQPRGELNPWNAGTLEWISEPEENWGVRSIPIVRSRYPLWDQKDLARKVNEGRYYLPDAEEGWREGLVTSVLDAEPIQVLRVGGTSYVTIVSALSLGAAFIALTFHWWIATALAAIICFCAVIYWLWTGTGEIPEKPEKNVGLGLSLPLYASGPDSVGWWAMFITMVGDGTAFASLVFGYFFYWTIHADFTAGIAGPDAVWSLVAAILFAAAWGLMVAARTFNRRGATAAMRGLLVLSLLTTVGASAAGLAGPWSPGMEPTRHVYPAIVWILVLWVLAHGAVGTVMQAYCLARSLAGRLTPKHDMDLGNVVLYWHFLLVTAVITFTIIGLFPAAM